MRKILIGIICIVLMTNVSGKALSGLILSGIDTFFTKNQLGFDFVTKENCTTFVNIAPYTCVDHFRIFLNTYTLKYVVDVPLGYSIKMGKINLDSIKTAPADSFFLKQPIGQGDSIPVDSLSSRIGNVYLMKTAKDPRPFYDVPFYVKLKIIKFITLDSAQYQIKMVFLWAFNISGDSDLHTTGLDTFHLNTPTLNQPNNNLAKSVNRAASSQYVFKVVGDRFVLPRELVGKVKSVTVWDLRGRIVGRVEVGNEIIFNLNKITKGKDIILLRVER